MIIDFTFYMIIEFTFYMIIDFTFYMIIGSKFFHNNFILKRDCVLNTLNWFAPNKKKTLPGFITIDLFWNWLHCCTEENLQCKIVVLVP